MLKDSTSCCKQDSFVFDLRVAEVFFSRIKKSSGLYSGIAQREGSALSAGGQPVALRRCGRL